MSRGDGITELTCALWQDLLGPDLTERLVAEAHADIPAVKAELKAVGESYRERTLKRLAKAASV